MIWLDPFQDLQDLIDVETSLDRVKVSGYELLLLAELVLDAVDLAALAAGLFVVIAEVVEAVNLLLRVVAANLVNIYVDHFGDKVLNVYLIQDDIVRFLGDCQIFDVADCQQGL